MNRNRGRVFHHTGGVGAALLGVVILLCTVLAWPVGRLGAPVRTVFLLTLLGAMAALVWLLPREDRIQRTVVTVLAAACGCKVATLVIEGEWWARRGFRDWVSGLANMNILIHRLHEAAPARARVDGRTLRVLVQVPLGVGMLVWAFSMDWPPGALLVEHFVKLLGAYLAFFDGAFLVGEALTRLMGFRSLALTRDPILALTPADFWRRYNMEAGRFLREAIYVRFMPGLGRTGAILATFAANGLLHEYLLWTIVGRIEGYQIAFFLVHGAAVALTWRWRPRSMVGRIAAHTLTIAFLYFSSVLFFASVHHAFGWWTRDLAPW